MTPTSWASWPSGSSMWSPPTSPKSTSAGLSNARKSGLWRTAGSRSPMTGTGSAAAGSPSPRRSARCSGRRFWRTPPPSTARHSATPAGLGHAFCEYVERYPTDRLPQAGGVNATVVVRMTLESLLGDSEEPATLDTGHLITAGQARRLACEAGLIPMVLGSRSQVLDVGRGCRFYTKPQRVVLDDRDKTCTAVGCDWPAWMCHAHHDIPWSRGGRPTSTTDDCCVRGITPMRTPRRTR